METNVRGVSQVNVIPRLNNVLVRMEFTTSILALTSGKYDKDSAEEVIFTAAGVGPHVKDITLGEKLLMEITTQYHSVEVAGNSNSIKALKEFYDAMTKADLNKLMHDPSQNKIKVTQYGIFPEFAIKAHIE